MSWVLVLLEALMRVLLPAIIETSKRTATDATPQPALCHRLRARVRNTWVLSGLLPCVLIIGCTRTIYVPHGEPVRLRETVEGVKVWVMGPDGTPIAGAMDLPEGWYALPMDSEE